MRKPLIKIPYANVAGQHSTIRDELLEALAGVLDHSQFILGDEVTIFEQRFAELIGVRFAVALSSGTDALILALRALGVGRGDEVITVPNSFVASASCIALLGARPVFIDICDDYNANPELLEQVITPKTKVILPVHLTGRAANMDPILDVARAHGLRVVEDCAQAVLAEYCGKRVGSFGTFGCFSLHPLKTLNACGAGGVLTTNDEALYEQIKILRNNGLRTRDQCVIWSANSRLDTLQAAVLLVKMNYLDTWTESRRENAAFYQTTLSGLAGVQVPIDRPYEKPVYHTFVIQAERRDELKKYLAHKGIETAIHYPVPIHLQPAAADLGYGPGSFPVAERLAGCILSLPVHPELTSNDLDNVASAIRNFYGS